MLYQLSYASSQGHTPFSGHMDPLDPFRLSGTTVKVITTAIYVQGAGFSFLSQSQLAHLSVSFRVL
jgi:hypothetical protein